ncbi:MAG TPA: RNA polymerase sigma factor [Clostridia bacterium]|nr:RNA polymerase sigma factor [Clostridia bacterium]
MEKEALLMLFGNHLEELTLYAIKRIGNVENARDMVSELALALLSRSEDSEEIRYPMAYFKTSLRNMVYDTRNEKTASIPVDPCDPLWNSTISERQLEQETDLVELLAWLDQQLVSCPPQIAEAFRLRYLDGYPLGEVARMVDIPANTLAQRFRRLRMQLKKSYPEIWATFVLVFKIV